jgi:WD40 repeat protein
VIHADVPALALSSDGGYLAAAMQRPKTHVLTVYDTSQGVPIASIPMHSGTTALAFSDNGEWLGAGSEKGLITILSPFGRLRLHTCAWTPTNCAELR